MSRMGRRNKQKIYYSLWLKDQPVFDRDRDGNIRLDKDGNPIETGDLMDIYSPAIECRTNIQSAGGQIESGAFGSYPDYDAIIVSKKGELPFEPNTIIWYTSTPKKKKDGNIDDKSADYIVKRIPPSLNEMVYLLKSIV